MAHSNSFAKGYAKQKCVFFEILHLFMSLWDIEWVETRDLGAEPPVKKIYYSFWIFQNCFIYDFGSILNSPAILLICVTTTSNFENEIKLVKHLVHF